MIGLWLLATAATTAIAYVAVNAAGAEVTDRPLTSVVATDATTSTTDTSTNTTASTSTTAGPATTGSGPTGTTAANGSTTTATASTSSTATTVTTALEAPWQHATIPSVGGLVIVSYRTGEVRLESVAPTPGFSYEIDEQGPPRVRVKLEGGDVKVEVRVRWDGGLVTEVDEDA